MWGTTPHCQGSPSTLPFFTREGGRRWNHTIHQPPGPAAASHSSRYSAYALAGKPTIKHFLSPTDRAWLKIKTTIQDVVINGKFILSSISTPTSRECSLGPEGGREEGGDRAQTGPWGPHPETFYAGDMKHSPPSPPLSAILQVALNVCFKTKNQNTVAPDKVWHILPKSCSCY